MTYLRLTASGHCLHDLSMLMFETGSKAIRSRPRLFFSFVIIAAISLSVAFFSNMSMMSISWAFPYFSGAANFHALFDWQISPSDYAIAQQLNLSDYRQYSHGATEDTVGYSLNSYGYVLIALVSSNLFSWLGDIEAAICFQVIVHILVCVFLGVFVLDDVKSKFLFVLLYAANPLIIHFVTFPFYYFWLSMPSVCIATLILRPAWASRVVLFSTPLLLISLLIRPTTLFLCALFYVFALIYLPLRHRILGAIGFSLFVVGVVLISHFNPRTPPYHTMYVGLGGYPNNVGVERLSDDEGFRYFTSKTNIEISTNPIDGNWATPELLGLYNQVVKRRYVHILFNYPGLAIRNAFLNLGQVFSIGYVVKSPLLSLLSSVLGFVLLLFLLLRKQFLWVVAVLSSALTFFWYFPPIPAYNFAAYLLLVCGVLSAFKGTAKA